MGATPVMAGQPMGVQAMGVGGMPMAGMPEMFGPMGGGMGGMIVMEIDADPLMMGGMGMDPLLGALMGGGMPMGVGGMDMVPIAAGPGGSMMMAGGPGMGALALPPRGQPINMDDLPFSSIGHKAMWQAIFDQ